MYMESTAFLKKIPVKIPHENLSPLSCVFIDRIIHQIHLGQNAWKTITSYTPLKNYNGTLSFARGVPLEIQGQQLPINELNGTPPLGACPHPHRFKEHVLDQSEIPKGLHFHHIVAEIREEIDTFRKIGKQYTFVIGARKFTIYAIVPYRTRVNAKRAYAYLDKAVQKMFVWLYVATHFAPAECSRELVIYWYLTGHEKRLPETRGAPVGEEHANTAFTLACPAGAANGIYIFRKEEWFKVLIHETFHSLGLDFARMPEQETNRALFSIFPVRCDYRLYEAYTETWATILHSLFVAMETKGNIYTKLEKCIYTERMFSLFQKEKLLLHYDLNYDDVCSVLNAHRYKETTNAFAYFILKTIMLFNFNEFIEWCDHKNKGVIAFKRIQANILSLVDFVRKNHKSVEYKRALEAMKKWITTTRYNGPEMTSMRMTALS